MNKNNFSVNKASQRSQHSILQSTCAYCGVGCGVDVSLSKGVPVSIAGTPEHPANFGRLCVKGQHLLDTIDVTGRLLAPQIGESEVDWQLAIDTVANKFKDTIDTYGPDSVAFYVSGQMLTEDYYVANKLMKGFIGSGNIDTNSRLCMSSAVSAYKRAFGEDIVPCSYNDLEHTEFLVLIGSNAAWTHPVLFQRIERARKINPDLKLVVIDPRSSATTVTADIHLAIKPGTDAALFNGLLNYLAKNNGLDVSYIEKYTIGFEECLQVASSWSIEKTAEYCRLPEEQLLCFFNGFLKASKAVTMYSMGINQSTSGVDKCNTIINTHLASGKIGKKGSGPFSITGQPNAMGGREVGGLANQLTAHLDIENKAHRELVQQFWQSPTIATKQGAKAVDMFKLIKQGKIKAVWIMATNPMVSLPNNNEVSQALAACEFVVVSDCVADNDTLAYADVKLPATPWLEKNGTVTNSERRISRQRSGIEISGLAKHDWQIISLVAQAMGYQGFEYSHPYQIFSEFAALSGFNNSGNTKRLFDISGLSNLDENQYDQLLPIQWPVNHYYPNGCQQLLAKGDFPTDSGRASFIAVEPRMPIQSTDDKFPLVLNSGRYRDQWHTMTRTGKAAKLSQHLAKPYLAISASDAAKYEVTEEGLVQVESKVGQIIVPVKITDEQTPGTCFLPIHWNNQFASSARISSLYLDAVDPISGQPEMKYTGVRIEAKTYLQYADIYVDRKIELETDYWLKTKTDYGWHYQVGLDEQLSIETWSTMLSIEGEWLSLDNGSNKQLICLNGTKIVCVIYASEHTFKQTNWVAKYFVKDNISFADVQVLLSGIAPSAEMTSRKICSCFGVTEQQIKSAIDKGCNTVDELGNKLKCGTNCGSCKPELQLLVDQFSMTENKLIPITELAGE